MGQDAETTLKKLEPYLQIERQRSPAGTSVAPSAPLVELDSKESYAVDLEEEMQHAYMAQDGAPSTDRYTAIMVAVVVAMFMVALAVAVSGVEIPGFMRCALSLLVAALLLVVTFVS